MRKGLFAMYWSRLRLEDVFHSVFDDYLRSFEAALSNVEETATAFKITLDIPGVAKENVDISTEKGILTIKATRTAHIVYNRSYRLPESADRDGIMASVIDGVLIVIIPKV